jgi:hypothetical protein
MIFTKVCRDSHSSLLGTEEGNILTKGNFSQFYKGKFMPYF